jgi:hypothetical protein
MVMIHKYINTKQKVNPLVSLLLDILNLQQIKYLIKMNTVKGTELVGSHGHGNNEQTQ